MAAAAIPCPGTLRGDGFAGGIVEFKSGRKFHAAVLHEDDLAVWVFLFFGQFNGVAAEEEIRDFVDDVICRLFKYFFPTCTPSR